MRDKHSSRRAYAASLKTKGRPLPNETVPEITVNYTAVDGARLTRKYKTLTAARKFAVEYVGQYPDISQTWHYAVSADGVGKITVTGVTLQQLFGVTY